jgi:hypothetical protein
MYHITSYSKKKAKELNVQIRPSTNPKKKLDVYKDNNKIASIGAIGYNDYPTYIMKNGLKYANERRKLYKQRHEKDRLVKNSNGFFSDNILW